MSLFMNLLQHSAKKFILRIMSLFMNLLQHSAKKKFKMLHSFHVWTWTTMVYKQWGKTCHIHSNV